MDHIMQLWYHISACESDAENRNAPQELERYSYFVLWSCKFRNVLWGSCYLEYMLCGMGVENSFESRNQGSVAFKDNYIRLGLKRSYSDEAIPLCDTRAARMA